MTSDSPRRRVLVVDDEVSIVDAVATALRYEGFDVLEAHNGRVGLALAQSDRPDLIVLDVMLPDVDGFEVARRVRADGLTTPILFLSARDALDDKVEGFSAGADDYVTKPFSLAEIVMRVRAILQRTAPTGRETHQLTYSDVVLDSDTREVWRAGVPIDLTATEFNLLQFFMLNPRRVLSKPQILDHVWHYDFDGDSNILETYISYVRKKLNRLGPPLIHTVRLVGYVLRASESESEVSLRARLVVATGAVALIALAGAGMATYSAFSRAQLREVDDSLQRVHEPIEQALSSDRDGDDVVERAAPGTFVALREASGATVLAIPLREPGREPATVDLSRFDDVRWPAATGGQDADPAVYRTADVTGSEDQLRLRISLLDDGSVLFVGQPLHAIEESRRQLLTIEIVVMAGALAVAVGLGWLLVSAGLRPLRRVESTALAVADGRLDQRAPGADDHSEVGRLAAALNTMLDRIHESFAERDATEAALRESQQRMRRFVADVSHELRTPLAAVTAYAELFERGARTRPDDVERAIHGIATETGRMNELVEELLLLARLDEGRPLEQVTVDMAALLVDAARTAQTVAPEHPVALSIADVVTVTGDAIRLRQAIDNLLANVRAHTPPGTTTSITLTTDPDDAVITVADNGPGMRTEDADRVFERFYRTDSSRSRQTGGAGLGLPIVAAIVAAHGGTVGVETAPGAGVRVVVRIPRSPPLTSPGADDDE